MLLGVCRRYQGFQYLIDCEGYGPEKRLWVSASNIMDPDFIRDLHYQEPVVSMFLAISFFEIFVFSFILVGVCAFPVFLSSVRHVYLNHASPSFCPRSSCDSSQCSSSSLCLFSKCMTLCLIIGLLLLEFYLSFPIVCASLI